MRLFTAAMLSMAIAACGGSELPDSTASVKWMAGPSSAATKSATPSNVTDHGGKVLSASTTVALYWGSQADFPSDLQAGMTSLLQGFGGSSYLGIASQYMRGAAITSSYGGALFDSSAPPSHSPRTAELGAEVCKLVAQPDPNTLYIVFTSNAPKLNYCAFHDRATCNGTTFEVAYVPNQGQLLSGCSPFIKSNLSCNSYSEATIATADSVAHEFMETVTDAHIDAWYDQGKAEIGDKCNFVYQHCVTLGNNSTWQIQAEWSNAITGCQQ
jgi:hypothetical protein